MRTTLCRIAARLRDIESFRIKKKKPHPVEEGAFALRQFGLDGINLANKYNIIHLGGNFQLRLWADGILNP